MFEQNNQAPEVEVQIVPEETEVTSDEKFSFDEKSLIAAASYVGPLIIIPFLTNKEDPFTRFHLKQGILVFIPSLVIWAFSGYMFSLWPLMRIFSLAILVLLVIGIMNALQGKERALPLIGHFSSKIKL